MELRSGLLAEYALEVSADDFSTEVIDQAQRLVLDSLGCGIGAFTSDPSKALREIYATTSDSGSGATVLGTDRTIPVENAALINAAMVRYLDYNDTYISGSSVCHPSDHIPVLLAVAEAEGRTGLELVEALVVAYEIKCALIDTGAIWHEGFDYVTWGSFSGTAAIGKLMGLSQEQIVDAMGMAGASGNGLLVSRLGDVSMWKGIAQGFVLHNAVQACQMARAGVTGPTEIFEGPSGFFETVSKEPITIDRMGGRDGPTYRITRTNYKPYACGYFMQAPITAVLDIIEDNDIDVSAIEAIEIEEFEQAVQVLASPEKWSTDLSRETADHSIPYTVAVAILDREVTPRQYEADRLQDPRVHTLMETVSVEVAEDITRRRAENPGLIPARARIVTGTDTYETEIDYPNGHWKDPMTEAQVEEKFTNLARGYLSDEQIGDAIDACDDLAEATDVTGLLDTLRI